MTIDHCYDGSRAHGVLGSGSARTVRLMRRAPRCEWPPMGPRRERARRPTASLTSFRIAGIDDEGGNDARHISQRVSR
jgi:hypothetical protein